MRSFGVYWLMVKMALNDVSESCSFVWMINVTLILNGSSQKIVRRGQITVPRRPIDIRISADYSIFENGAQKSDCYVGCVCLNDDVWIFWAPNATILLIDIASDVKMGFIWKDDFSVKMLIFDQTIEWGNVRPAVAVIWMMLCCILKWKVSIFLIKPYFRKNIHKFFFYSRFKLQMLDSPPCTYIISLCPGFFLSIYRKQLLLPGIPNSICLKLSKG